MKILESLFFLFRRPGKKRESETRADAASRLAILEQLAAAQAASLVRAEQTIRILEEARILFLAALAMREGGVFEISEVVLTTASDGTWGVEITRDEKKGVFRTTLVKKEIPPSSPEKEERDC